MENNLPSVLGVESLSNPKTALYECRVCKRLWWSVPKITNCIYCNSLQVTWKNWKEWEKAHRHWNEKTNRYEFS